MKCARCGKELTSSARCEFCGYEGNVREMSGSENFKGVTIETEGTEVKTRRMTYINYGGGILSRLIEKFVRGLLNGNFLAKIVAGLILVAAFGIIFFAAVPIMFFILALGLGIILYAKIKE